ncbi:LLM class flavin-dependent oxidoreductase, partial [Methylobacterium radiotolerans]
MEPVRSPPVLLGLNTFGDVGLGPDGAPKPEAQVIREVVEEGVLADQV